jgi:hypothetical protein
MDTIVLYTARFFSQAIRRQRTSAARSRSQRHACAAPGTLAVSRSVRESLEALPRPEATPARMVGATRTTRVDCTVVDTLPLLLWHDAAPTPEDTGKTRTRWGIVSRLEWGPLVLLLGSVGSDIRRV